MSTSISPTISEDVVSKSQYPAGVPLLIIDDDVDVRTTMRRSLEKEFRIRVVEAGDLAEARALLEDKTQEFSLVFLDKRLPDGNGVEFFPEIKRERPDLSVVIITGDGSGMEARTQLGNGAFEYLPKPFPLSEMRRIVTDRYPGLSAGFGPVTLGPLVDGSEGEVEGDSELELVAHSPSMICVTRDLSRTAKMSDTSVIISGPTGSGKGIIASLIHQWSPRANKKFLTLNCGAVPQDLIESTLFGHIRGAFTNAHADRKGYFEEADGGTIFLDEITETSPAFQVKLLRVLEEGCITRVGSSQEIKLNVRVIAATNRNVKDFGSSGLRKDLYYRLSGAEVFLPPLSDRPEDIIPLATYFALKPLCKVKGRLWFSAQVVDALKAYQWPGNVRELSSVVLEAVDKAVAGRSSEIMLVSDLRKDVRAAVGDLQTKPESLVGALDEIKSLDEIEEEHVLRVLRLVDGNMSAAARRLKRSPRWFAQKCRSNGWVAKALEAK